MSDTNKLTPKQALFVAEYAKDLNGTQAAIRAGYSAKSAEAQASTLLRNPKVKAAVCDAKSRQVERIALDADAVLSEFLRIAMSDVGDLFDDQGNLRPIKDIPKDLRRAISGIEVLKRNVTAGDGQMDSVHKIRLWDKTKALDSLAKHLGLMVEKVEHAGTVELVWKE